MDPVTIGVAVVALLGTKFVEEVATQAGSSTWRAVQQLNARVRTRLSRRGAVALDRIREGGVGNEEGGVADEEGAIVAAEVEAAAASDPTFRSDIEALLTEAGQSPHLATVLAVARENARQVNIGGDNHGAITF